MAHLELDARRLLCPMPVIKAQNLAKSLNHGDVLTVIATDPGAEQDVPAWARINGHQVLQCQRLDKEIHISIEIHKDV